MEEIEERDVFIGFASWVWRHGESTNHAKACFLVIMIIFKTGLATECVTNIATSIAVCNLLICT